MTLDEFIALEPVLGTSLKRWMPNTHGVVDVEKLDDGRWRACCINWIYGDVENVMQATCHENCGRMAIESSNKELHRNRWVWEGHECCVECEHNPMHYYETLHE